MFQPISVDSLILTVKPHSLFFSPSTHQSCHLFLALLPFFLSTAIFFYLVNPDLPGSVLFAGIKTAPVLLLAAVVLSWNRGQSFLGVVGGLVFSAVGDWCLVWREHFLLGTCRDIFWMVYISVFTLNYKPWIPHQTWLY